MRLTGRDFLSLKDYSKYEIELIIKMAEEFKILDKARLLMPKLHGRFVALLFALPSTRTRVSFEVAIAKLGGVPLYLRWEELQLKRGETLADTARVLSRYVDAIVARLPSHELLLELARYADVPVINALTDLFHPCQALADLMTIKEKKGFSNIKVAYVGDGFNNVCHSLILACTKLGIDIAVATPRGYEPSPQVIEIARKEASLSGSKLELFNTPVKAVKDADVIYTDVFISMGREEERERRIRDFKGWQVNKNLVKYAKPDYIFMHCLPAHRGEEVASDIIDDPIHSVVWDQAENRLYTEIALLTLLIP